MKIQNVSIYPMGVKNLSFKGATTYPNSFLEGTIGDIAEFSSSYAAKTQNKKHTEVENPTQYAQDVISDAHFLYDEVMNIFRFRETIDPKKNNMEYALKDGAFVMMEKTSDGALERESRLGLTKNGGFYLKSVSIPVNKRDERSDIYNFDECGTLIRYEEASETYGGNKQCAKILEFDPKGEELKSFGEHYFYSADEGKETYASRIVFDTDDSSIPF